MALPRRPNLLALFPGISNDWQAAEEGAETDRQTQSVGERERDGGRGNREVTQGKERKTERNEEGSGRGLGERKKRQGEGRRGEVGRETETWAIGRLVIQQQEHTGGAHERGTEWNTDRQTQRWEETDRNGKKGEAKRKKKGGAVAGRRRRGSAEDRRHVNM